MYRPRRRRRARREACTARRPDGRSMYTPRDPATGRARSLNTFRARCQPIPDDWRRGPPPAERGGTVSTVTQVLSIVLAGGEGKRLLPLTLDRAKPAVPFGGQYRLVDFVLSNLANAGFQ